MQASFPPPVQPPTGPPHDRDPPTFPVLPNPQPSQMAQSSQTQTPVQPPQNANPPGLPPSISLIDAGRQYRLDVVQQPQRARMCGFGDKDRRPITPPPCVRLIISDSLTGKEIDMNDINYNMFVLNVDLWNEDGTKEVNLVRHATQSPSISSATPTSYAQMHDQSVTAYSLPHPLNREPGRDYSYSSSSPPYPYSQPTSAGGYSSNSNFNGQYPPPSYPSSPSSAPYTPSYQDGPGHYGNGTPRAMDYTGRPAQPPYNGYSEMGLSRIPNTSSSGPGGMFTRNLIGSLAASAFRLTDPSDKIGIWFVLQDLSVRTEGSFRLRFSFVNVGKPGKTANGDPANENSILNTGKAPVLAACYSDVFTVYSAKKFPGVVESTPLSRCFATQGIKIPIRKDGPSRPRDEYDAD